MQLDFPLVAQNVDFIYALLLPVAFLHTGAQSALHKPLRHSLFITGVAWLLTAVCLGWKTRRSGGEGGSRLRKLSVLAGLLYALAQVCERVGVNRENYWWTKVRCFPPNSNRIQRPAGTDTLSSRCYPCLPSSSFEADSIRSWTGSRTMNTSSKRARKAVRISLVDSYWQ